MPVGDSTPYGPVLWEARPTGEKVFKDWVAPLGLSVLVTPLLLVWRNPDIERVELVVAMAAMVVLVTVILVLLWLRKSRTRVQITPTHVTRRRATGQEVAPRAELVEAVLAQEYAVPGVHSPALFLTDASTRTRILLTGPVWTEDELRTIGQCTQQLTVVPVLSVEEGRTRWPRMMPWSNRHPRLSMAIGALGALVIVAVLVGLAFLLFS